MTTDERYMKEAIRQAKKAEALGEVPIGCVIVKEDKIVARGYNRRNTDKNTLSHAELNAIRRASKKLGDWRLEGCTMYVTLEPCQMCSGAIVQARISRVVIGSMNPKAGCAGSIINLLNMPAFNHQVELTRDVLKDECGEMLTDFFKNIRKKQKADAASVTFREFLQKGLPGYEIRKGRELVTDISGIDTEPDPGKKSCGAFYKKGNCVAVADFISDYPEKGTGLCSFRLLDDKLVKKGVGAKLFHHVEAAAEKMKMERLIFTCPKSCEVHREFWEKAGFQLIRQEKNERDETLYYLTRCI